MDLLISDAMAQQGGGGAAASGGLLRLVIMLAIFGVAFYFLIIRPQKQRAKQHREMIAGLNRGDEVLTYGGLLGRVSEIGADFLSIEIAENVEVRLQKASVYQVLPKGTWKQKLEKPSGGDDKGDNNS